MVSHVSKYSHVRHMASHVSLCMQVWRSIKGGGDQFVEEGRSKKGRRMKKKRDKKESEKKREKEKKGREKEGEKEVGVLMIGTRRTKKYSLYIR